MMMKQKLIMAALPALVLAVLVAACDQPSGGGGTPAPTTGTLTVQNATASGSVVICDSGMPASIAEMTQFISGAIAVGQATSATSYKLNSSSAGSFTSTGDFLVVLTTGMTNYLKVVSFTNGSGTVDFDDMIEQSTLPAI
jgi:hypothetical protein